MTPYEWLSGLIVMAFGVSWAEERIGWFQERSPQTKQAINTILTFIVPAIATYLPTVEGLPGPEAALSNAVWLVAPVVCWLVSQVAHAVDAKLIK